MEIIDPKTGKRFARRTSISVKNRFRPKVDPDELKRRIAASVAIQKCDTKIANVAKIIKVIQAKRKKHIGQIRRDLERETMANWVLMIKDQHNQQVDEQKRKRQAQRQQQKESNNNDVNSGQTVGPVQGSSENG